MISMEGKQQGLIEPLRELEGMHKVLEALKRKKNAKVVNMVDACKAHFLYAVSEFLETSPVIITYDEISTKRLAEDLQSLIGEEQVYVYPSRDILFYNADVHSMDITSARIKVIEALNEKKKGTFIIPVEALLNPLSPRATWQSYTKVLKVGDCIQLDKLEAYLVEIGYTRVAKVEGMGQFAIRGGIIDIYTPIDNEPYRLELWDDELDSIRAFNVQTQRSIHKIEELKVVPNQEIIFPLTLLKKAIPSIREELKKVTKNLREEGRKESAVILESHVKECIEQIENDISPSGLELYVPYTDLETVSILDYVNTNTILYIDEPLKNEEKAHRILYEYGESMKDRLQYGHILPKQIELMFTYEDIIGKLSAYPSLFMMNLDRELPSFEVETRMNLESMKIIPSIRVLIY